MIYKPPGLTPRQTIEALREARADLRDTTLGYAGRLDPMAEGLLLVLVGDENKQQSRYLGLTKAYRFETLLGFATDTYDALGIVTETDGTARPTFSSIQTALERFRGTFVQPFPPYSSAPVRGRPLYYWARQGQLGEISRPERARTVEAIELISMHTVSPDVLWQRIDTAVRVVHGNFRQDAVLASWQQQLDKAGPGPFVIATAEILCSSGTYVRSIAHDLGRSLGTCALALHIVRTQIGGHTLSHAYHLPTHSRSPEPR